MNWGTFVSSVNLRKGQKEKTRDKSELCCLYLGAYTHVCACICEKNTTEKRGNEKGER